MLPGLSIEVESRLDSFLDTRTTSVNLAALGAGDLTLLSTDDEAAQALGVQNVGPRPAMLVVTDPTRRLGNVRVATIGHDALLFFDNRIWSGEIQANFQICGSDCALLFCDIGAGYVSLPTVLLRSDRQLLFWGQGATAVGCNIEIEGIGRSVAIGDDALISSGVFPSEPRHARDP
jgi:hypothetical protein